jgi:hypothetical protein
MRPLKSTLSAAKKEITMCKIIYEAVERELNGIGVGLQLRTPDNIDEPVKTLKYIST